MNKLNTLRIVICSVCALNAITYSAVASSAEAAPKSCVPSPVSVPKVPPTHAKVAYATGSPSQQLDIYLPKTGTGPFPVIVFIHGGGFMVGDKNDGQEVPAVSAVDRGYAVVSVNYRMSGEAKFPAAIHDIKAAIRFIKANAAKYHLDPSKVATWGDSAGAHFAALVGTSGGGKGT